MNLCLNKGYGLQDYGEATYWDKQSLMRDGWDDLSTTKFPKLAYACECRGLVKNHVYVLRMVD